MSVLVVRAASRLQFFRSASPLSSRSWNVHQSQCNNSTTTTKALFDKAVRVPNFGGTLSAKTPFDISISPAGTQDNPSLDRALVRVFTDNPELKKDDIKVKVTQDGKKLDVSTESISVKYDQLKTVKEEIEIPMVHNMNVKGEFHNLNV